MKKLLAAVVATIALNVNAFTITGAGATFPYPVYAKWAAVYQAETGNQINYQAIGSSGGIKQIDAKTVDFGASDVARKQSDLDKRGQIQFPMVMGGVVVVVNLSGIQKNQLNITTNQVADIFSGKIRNWKEVSTDLPDKAITIAHRSDGSGTTEIFTRYLSNRSDNFKKIIGSGKTVNWQGNAIGGKGNAGVSAMVKQVDGSIGYVEYAYAKQNSLTTVKIDNVTPNADNFKNGRWGLTASTFIIVYANGANNKEIFKFFEWCYKNDKIAEDLDYVPLSEKVKSESRTLWESAK